MVLRSKPCEELRKESSRERELQFSQLNGWLVLICLHFFVNATSSAGNAFPPLAYTGQSHWKQYQIVVMSVDSELEVDLVLSSPLRSCVALGNSLHLYEP